MVEIHDSRPEEVDTLVALVIERCPWLNDAIVRPAYTEGFVTDLKSLTATENGQVVGTAIQGFFPGEPPGRMVHYVIVAPGHVGRGIGRELRQGLLDALPTAADEINAAVADEDQHAVDVVRHWGFRTDQLSINSVLDLTDLPEVQLPDGLIAQWTSDYEFVDADIVDAMYARSQTNPEALRDGAQTLAARTAQLNDEATEVVLVLREGSAPVAVVFGSLVGDTAQVFYTGVDPAHRGRGLAKVAKQLWHLRVRDLGATRAMTNNEQGNTGIRRVNAELGYVKLNGAYWVSKTVER